MIPQIKQLIDQLWSVEFDGASMAFLAEARRVISKIHASGGSPGGSAVIRQTGAALIGIAEERGARLIEGIRRILLAAPEALTGDDQSALRTRFADSLASIQRSISTNARGGSGPGQSVMTGNEVARVEMQFSEPKRRLAHSFELMFLEVARDRDRAGASGNVFYLSGLNPRVNINSTDASANSVTVNELFLRLRGEIKSKIADAEQKDAILGVT